MRKEWLHSQASSSGYNVTLGWAEQRTAWWNMLQQILVSGTDVQTAADDYVATCNEATAAASK